MLQTSPQSAAPQQELFGQPLQAVLGQPGLLPPNLVFQLTDQPLQQQQQQQQKQKQLQPSYLQQQQLNHGQMRTRQGSSPTSNMHQAMQTGLGNNFMSMTGNMQDGLGTGESHGKSAYGHNNEDTQNMRLM